MTPDQIKEARLIIAAATPGPWESKRYNDFWHIYTTTKPLAERFDLIDEPNDGDANFIVAARTGWPEALDEVERYQEALRDANKCYAEMMQERDSLRAENERLKTFINPKLLDDNLAGKWVLSTEVDKLRAVAEAAERLNSQMVANTGKVLSYELRDALKAWRGEPGTDANLKGDQDASR